MPLFLRDSQVNISLGIIHYSFPEHYVEGFTFAIKLIVAVLHFLFLIDFMFKKSVKNSENYVLKIQDNNKKPDKTN